MDIYDYIAVVVSARAFMIAFLLFFTLTEFL